MKVKLFINSSFKIYIIISIIFIIIVTTLLTFKPLFGAIASEDTKVDIPILMYHSILKDKNYQGKYVVSPSVFEEDLKYFKDQGYETIVMQDLIDYVYNDKELPKKPLIITFDDGYYNNYHYIYPILKKYNMKMVLSIIVKYTDKYSEINEPNPNYAHVTWDNINEMQESGLVEIQNHSYDLHHQNGKYIGAKNMDFESKEQYKERLTEDLIKSQNRIEEMTGKRPTTFIYPFGINSEASEEVICEVGFKASLIVENKIPTIRKDPNCLYNIYRQIRPGGISTYNFMKEHNL